MSGDTVEKPRLIMLAINLVKRPRISKTTLPDLVDRLGSVKVTRTLRSTAYRQRRPPPHTVLMVVRQLVELIGKKLSGPSTLAT